AVAGVDGVDLVLAGQRDDVVDIEVGANRFAGPANAIGLVGLEAVQRKAVLVRVESDVAQPEFVAGAEDADGDLAAVGDHELAERSDRRRCLRHWSVVLCSVSFGLFPSLAARGRALPASGGSLTQYKVRSVTTQRDSDEGLNRY